MAEEKSVIIQLMLLFLNFRELPDVCYDGLFGVLYLHFFSILMQLKLI